MEGTQKALKSQTLVLSHISTLDLETGPFCSVSSTADLPRTGKAVLLEPKRSPLSKLLTPWVVLGVHLVHCAGNSALRCPLPLLPSLISSAGSLQALYLNPAICHHPRMWSTPVKTAQVCSLGNRREGGLFLNFTGNST